FHGAVLTRRGDPPASLIGAERQGVDLAVMSPEGVKLARGVVLQVPDLDRILLAPGCQPPAVRAEGHVQTRSGDPRADQARFLLLLQPLRVPEFHIPVSARRSQVLAALAKDQPGDFPFVGTERGDLLAGLSIPYLHGSIHLTRDQVAAVGAP